MTEKREVMRTWGGYQHGELRRHSFGREETRATFLARNHCVGFGFDPGQSSGPHRQVEGEASC